MAHHFENMSDTLPHSDIVRIKLAYKNIDPFLIVTGKLYDELTGDPIPGTVTFKLNKSGEVVMKDATEGGDDEYYAKLPGRKTYTYVAEGDLSKYLPAEGEIDASQISNTVEEQTIDIYLKRNPGLLLSGNLFDDSTKTKIPGFLEITYAGSDEVYKSIPVDSLDGYEIFLEKGAEYDLKFSSGGYLSKIVSYDLRDLDEYKTEKLDVNLQHLLGAKLNLKNIFFATAKADLLPTSYVELKKLLKIMSDYPNIVVEIAGHTDSHGSDSYNKDLSQRRAQSVVNYLVENGISEEQFVAHGYGEEVPIATNKTEEGRQLNRRVEFTVIEVK